MRRPAALLAATLLCAAPAAARRPAGPGGGLVANPAPVRLVRPPDRPLSEMATIGRALFFDPRLSASGRMSCATCHVPGRAYGPPAEPRLSRIARGPRAIPALRYVDRIPPFGIGPAPVDEGRGGAPGAAAGTTVAVPRGGLFWDGRAGTLQAQTMGPLFNPLEMGNADTAALAARLRRAYGPRLAAVVGRAALGDPRRVVDEAMFAIARFELEDRSFHPYSSKYDAWLEGRARLTAAEARGLAAFDDPARGNCASCHVDRPGPGGHPPAFSDWEYEALAVPGAGSRDRGLCGPLRSDLAARRDLCGMFRTPTLRNVALRPAFFHTGRTTSLAGVLDFYARRGVSVSAGHLGERDRRDIVAFLRTLTDGYRPAP